MKVNKTLVVGIVILLLGLALLSPLFTTDGEKEIQSNNTTQLPQSIKNDSNSKEMEIEIICSIRLQGHQLVGRVVKFPVSDIVYLMSNGIFEPLLDSSGKPMTIQEFELLWNAINQ